MKNDRIIPQAANDAAPVASGECPMCGRPVQVAYRPFCYKRCADLDLSRWLNGVYAVPVSEEEDEDGGGPER